MPNDQDKIYLNIDYEDAYVQPLILAALKSRLPPELLVFVHESEQPPPRDGKLLQWRQYESIDFEHLLAHPETCLANSYVIRKALIRKHYLSTTVSHWLTKHPDDARLRDHVKPSVEFEVDYAEFLDEALVEAWELKESWARNEGREDGDGGREWWILKPGMSERGQGIRLFSSEEELASIFEEWDPASDDDDEDDDDAATHSADEAAPHVTGSLLNEKDHNTGIITSQLRHFVAQPYIHPPLLLPPPHPSAGRKFHIRTYVLAVGALRVYVYRPMLALFAAQPYHSPSSSTVTSVNDALGGHLTNTCLQTGEREGSVHAFWDLPASIEGLPPPSTDGKGWREKVFTEICGTTAAVFEAAARSMGTHFQPLPNAFEVFGLDFLVDAQGGSWLLEVNAFPDFKQTGEECRGVVEGLFRGMVGVAVAPFFGVEGKDGGWKEGEEGGKEGEEGGMVRVLDVDLGRR